MNKSVAEKIDTFLQKQVPGLVPRKVRVRGKGGKVFERTQWVRPEKALRSKDFPEKMRISPLYPKGYKITFGEKEYHFRTKGEAQAFAEEYAKEKMREGQIRKWKEMTKIS